MTPHKSESVTLHKGDALIVVDLQNDFLPGGSLGVRRGEEIVPLINRYIKVFQEGGHPIYATRDWHPAGHSSFKEQGGPWPPHCVAHSDGAQFPARLQLPSSTTVISKGTKPDVDAYSGFQGTDLDERLRSSGIERLFIGGLATDYCVLNTVKDALKLGYQVLLLQDAVRAVNVHPDDGIRAEKEMTEKGAVPISFDMLAP